MRAKYLAIFLAASLLGNLVPVPAFSAPSSLALSRSAVPFEQSALAFIGAERLTGLRAFNQRVSRSFVELLSSARILTPALRLRIYSMGGAASMAGDDITEIVREQVLAELRSRSGILQSVDTHEWAALNPDLALQVQLTPVYIRHGFLIFDSVLLAYAGAGGEAGDQIGVHMSPAHFELLHSLSLEAQRDFWAHELEELRTPHVSEGEVRARASLWRVQSEIRERFSTPRDSLRFATLKLYVAIFSAVLFFGGLLVKVFFIWRSASARLAGIAPQVQSTVAPASPANPLKPLLHFMEIAGIATLGFNLLLIGTFTVIYWLSLRQERKTQASPRPIPFLEAPEPLALFHFMTKTLPEIFGHEALLEVMLIDIDFRPNAAKTSLTPSLTPLDLTNENVIRQLADVHAFNDAIWLHPAATPKSLWADAIFTKTMTDPRQLPYTQRPVILAINFSAFSVGPGRLKEARGKIESLMRILEERNYAIVGIFTTPSSGLPRKEEENIRKALSSGLSRLGVLASPEQVLRTIPLSVSPPTERGLAVVSENNFFIIERLHYLITELRENNLVFPSGEAIRARLTPASEQFLVDILKDNKKVLPRKSNVGIERRALASLLSAALYILQESKTPGAIGTAEFETFQAAVDQYNAKKYLVEDTGLLSLPLLFSLAVSPLAEGPEAESDLQELIRHFKNLPDPYRNDIIAFHFFQLAVHRGDYEKNEVFDLSALRELLPWFWNALEENSNSKSARIFFRSIALPLHQVLQFRGLLASVVPVKEIAPLIALLRRQQLTELKSKYPFASLLVYMGSDILFLNRGLSRPLDDVIADPKGLSASVFNKCFELIDSPATEDVAVKINGALFHEMAKHPDQIAAYYQKVINALQRLSAQPPLITDERLAKAA